MVIVLFGLIHAVMAATYHKHHKHDRITSMIQSTPTLVRRADSDSTGLPTLSTTVATTTSITHIPQLNNPYVNVPNLPTNLVFIIVGVILGAIFLLIITYRLVSYIKSGRRAHREKETYYSNLDEVLNTPYSYSRNSSALDLNSSSSSSNQGRSYRDNVLGNKATTTSNNMKNNNVRRSMFISPTMDLKNFDLPLYRNQHNGSLASLLLKIHNGDNSSTFFNEKSPTLFDVNTTSAAGSTINDSSINGSIMDSKYSVPPKSPLRAPSMVLEDLLNEEMKRSLSEKDISLKKKENGNEGDGDAEEEKK